MAQRRLGVWMQANHGGTSAAPFLTPGSVNTVTQVSPAQTLLAMCVVKCVEQLQKNSGLQYGVPGWQHVDSGTQQSYMGGGRQLGIGGSGRQLRKTNSSGDKDYAGIPVANFYCHVCKMRVWDHKAFSAHMKGQAHLKGMDLLEELYELQVKLLRHQAKFSIALQNAEAQQTRSPEARLHCRLCDVHYTKDSTSHRHQSYHQALRKFLCLGCKPCGKNFSTKIQWIEHRLTPKHMKKCAGNVGEMNPSVVEIDDFDLVEEAKEEVLNAKAPYAGGVSAMINRLVPKYDPHSVFSPKMVVKKQGFRCHSCMFFFEDKDAADLHCKSRTHYDRCVARKRGQPESSISCSELSNKTQCEDEEAHDKPAKKKRVRTRNRKPMPNSSNSCSEPSKKTQHEDEEGAEQDTENGTSDRDNKITHCENVLNIPEQGKTSENSDIAMETAENSTDVERSS